jgi:hypothetical protein
MRDMKLAASSSKIRRHAANPWRITLASYSLILPDDFDEYEEEVTSKGWFGNALLSISGKTYRLLFYDPIRLGQTIEDELRGDCAFFEPNLIIVRSVTRSAMESAVEFLIQSGQTKSLTAE